MSDILFKKKDYVFSYRVAGICMQNGKVLLQKATNDTGYAFPGGHVAFGETNKDALRREFREEIGADILVGALKWVAEIFFSWDGNHCHQICLYYMVTFNNVDIPKNGMFMAKEQVKGRTFNIEFHWIKLDELKSIKVYPPNAAELLEKINDGVQHFVDREN